MHKETEEEHDEYLHQQRLYREREEQEEQDRKDREAAARPQEVGTVGPFFLWIFGYMVLLAVMLAFPGKTGESESTWLAGVMNVVLRLYGLIPIYLVYRFFKKLKKRK